MAFILKLKTFFVKHRFILPFVILASLLATIVNSCQNEVKRTTVTSIRVIFDVTTDQEDPTTDKDNTLSSATTKTAFWGLPPIVFDKWRPNIHIKASTDNGNLINRTWDITSDANPDIYSLFEYSQILYYDSNYIQANIKPTDDATVDNTVIMPLAFEQKLYKRSNSEINKYDVSYDYSENSVVITLNTVNSNYLTLKTGTRIAIFATQRPSQWGATNDYTIVDAIPGNNTLQKSPNKNDIKIGTADRSQTRVLGYITYNGGVETYKELQWNGNWFEGIKLEPQKITIYMSHLKNGNIAKSYWDSIDSTPIKPFMLFWVAIQQ